MIQTSIYNYLDLNLDINSILNSEGINKVGSDGVKNIGGAKKYHQYSAKYRHSWICTTDDGSNGGTKNQKELMATFKYKTIKQNRVKAQPSTIDHLFPTLQCSSSLYSTNGSKRVVKTKVLPKKEILNTINNDGCPSIPVSNDPQNEAKKKKNKNIVILEILEKLNE
ncbi:hypothetical protein DICPUDRAFT_80998 [Dictyostelium purpureum]|uniref:Uncharacterized protein n=1 Tax=Dictyostelium purpureum TaxID=5786 RepID=F0ZS63_DICPU|nr:uncharacterized protein DICPUDRAFT_80998 [Dictyostelium purpureum]EGC33214.1 hypothetical protein DICPUDRAFT_80998 [Dictyostelium purpureum]|eukprot:XP_003290254.1 hypothetical protein DICPUDRAFT_80998 [Dictyostelium purpureum]